MYVSSLSKYKQNKLSRLWVLIKALLLEIILRIEQIPVAIMTIEFLSSGAK